MLVKNIYSFKDFSSIQSFAGTYLILIVAKSGWPVFGHTQVNSGQDISISYSLSWHWFSNVSRIPIWFSLIHTIVSDQFFSSKDQGFSFML